MKKKLLFVVDNLVMGGVTTVLVNLLNALDYTKYKVDLLVLHYYDDVEINLNPNVSIIKGDKSYKYIDKSLGEIVSEKNIAALFGKLKLVFSLKTGLIKNVIKKSRKKILTEKYDTEISFSDGFTEVFVANGDTPKKVAWMHGDISVHYDSARYIKLIAESLKKMDICVCVSKKVMEAYKAVFGMENICVINNIINDKKIIEKSAEDIGCPYKEGVINIVSVGRLCEAKNYFRLIKVHKKLIDGGYKINTYIVGDGLDREALENQIEEEKIADTFTLLGRKENPFPYVKKADLFVLSSTHEGLPTVLTESIILGTPCVSTLVAGAKEILGDSYGLVVDNSDVALYEGVKEVLDSGKIEVYRNNLKDYKFDSDKIIKEVEGVL